MKEIMLSEVFENKKVLSLPFCDQRHYSMLLVLWEAGWMECPDLQEKRHTLAVLMGLQDVEFDFLVSRLERSGFIDVYTFEPTVPGALK